MNVGEVFYENRLLPLKKSLKSSTIPVCQSESCLRHDVTRALRYCHLPDSGRHVTSVRQGISSQSSPFLSPEAALLSVSTKNRELWPGPTEVQRHSGFNWLCKHNRLIPEPIRFVRLSVFKRAVKREVYNSPQQFLGLKFQNRLIIYLKQYFFFHHDIIVTFIEI